VPTYQYACKACGHQFEQVQSFTDAALTECPECAGQLRKLYGSVGVVFKGSGFYRTDSRAKSSESSSSEKKESSEKKSSEKKESSAAKESSSSGSADKSPSTSSSSGTTTPAAKAS
jgi:putative FmdB family regulatory protein